MRTEKLTLLLAIAAAALVLPACGDTDPTPAESIPATVSPSVRAVETAMALNCPPPIGEVLIVTDSDNQWAHGKVVDSDMVLIPIAFGEVVFTDAVTGQTHTESPIAKKGADTTGAVECTFFQEFDQIEDSGDVDRGTVAGAVTVLVE